MGFVEHVKRALEIVQFKSRAIDETATDENSFSMGAGIIALAGAAYSVGTMMVFPGLVYFPIILLLVAILAAGVLHLLVKLAFNGEGEFLSFFRPFSYTYIVQWSTVVPLLGPVLGCFAGLWQLAVTVYVVERVYGVSRGKAITTVMLPIGVMLLLLLIFGSMAAVMLFVLASGRD